MIEAFSLKTAHYFGDAMSSQARLRYRVFVENRKLPHLYYDGLEYDEYDTPAAVYLVWRDPERIVRGLIRVLPTSEPYMFEEHWPHLCRTRTLPKSDRIWETTRVCVDRSYDARAKLRIMPELLCGLQEYCLRHGIEGVVGVTRQHLVNHFLREGVEWLGPPAEVEGELEAGFWIPAQHLRPLHHCRKYRIPDSVLLAEPAEEQLIAA